MGWVSEADEESEESPDDDEPLCEDELSDNSPTSSFGLTGSFNSVYKKRKRKREVY